MDMRPIGVFDSGLGGLTAVASLRRILPEEDLIYFGDTARVPYGGRSKETILKYARQDVRFLRSFDLKAILIACGTVTTTSLPTLQSENDLPLVGVVEPTCRRAAMVTRSKRVGIIATQASIRSGAYEAVLRRLDPEIQVLGQPCPLFVPLVENGRIHPGDVVIETVVWEYLTPLLQAGIDTLILGCTHYPCSRRFCAPSAAPAWSWSPPERNPPLSSSDYSRPRISGPGRTGRVLLPSMSVSGARILSASHRSFWGRPQPCGTEDRH